MGHRTRGIEVCDHENLVVVGSSPDSSPHISPHSSRPSSASARASSRPSSAGSRGSRPASASSLKSYPTPHLNKRQLQRLNVHKKRKERSLRNIFSDPVIEKSVGQLAEEVLKEDRAREFREHIQKVGGRFSRFSFKRTAISPDIVAPIRTPFTPVRPSFAPIQTHSNILGLEPEAHQEEEVAVPEIIEPISPVRIAARPVDIKSMSLHSCIAADASIGLASDSPSSCSHHTHAGAIRPVSATSRISYRDDAVITEGLSLSGDSLCGRIAESSGRGYAARSAYVTAVHNGIFQTSAPFSFRPGEKITFSGAHLPPQIVLGHVYTVSSTSSLSFKLANFRCNGCHVGIFQARVWDLDTQIQAIHPFNPPVCTILGAPVKDIDNTHSFAACAISQTVSSDSSAPAGTSSAHKLKNERKKSTSRCSSARRVASSFVNNINPLKISNLHDSLRCPALFPAEPPSSSVWKQSSAFLSSSTRSVQRNSQGNSAPDAAGNSVSLRRSSSAQSHRHPSKITAKFTANLGSMKSGVASILPSMMDVHHQRRDSLHFCTPVIPTPHHRVAALMSSRAPSNFQLVGPGLSQMYHFNDAAAGESSPRLCSDEQPVAKNANLRFDSSNLPDFQHQVVTALHCSPNMKPMHNKHDIPPMALSLNSILSKPRLYIAADGTLTSSQSSLIQGTSSQSSLIQGRAIPFPNKYNESTATASSNDQMICKQPSEICSDLLGEDVSESTFTATVDGRSEIAISGISLNNTCTRNSARFSFDSLSHKTPQQVPAADLSCASCMIISPALSNFDARCAPSTSVQSSPILAADPTSDQKSPATECSSKFKIEAAATSSTNVPALAIIGSVHSALKMQPSNEHLQGLDSTFSNSTTACCTERSTTSPRVPATTPRFSTNSVSTCEPSLQIEQNLPAFMIDRPFMSKQELDLACETHTNAPKNRSRLLLQSSCSLQPTLISSDQRCVSSDSLARQPVVKDSSFASLPWFANVSPSISVVKVANSTSYMKRDSGMTVTSDKAIVQMLSSKPSESDNVISHMPPAANLNLQEATDGSDDDEHISAISNNVKPKPSNETPVLGLSNSGPNHLRLLTSRKYTVRDVQSRTTATKQPTSRHRSAALIVPEAQSLLARLERDSKAFTQSSLPLHVKALQRNERRHQRVVMGADAIRAQKLDI